MSVVLGDALGPRGRRRAVVASGVASALALGLLLVALRRFSASGQLDPAKWSLLVKPAAIRFLLGGLVNTLRAAALALVIAVAAGTLFALGRLSRRLPVRLAAGAYVQFFRSLPLLVLIIFMYFGVPELGVSLSRYWALVIGPVIGRAVSTLLVAVWRPHRVAWPRDFRSIAHAVSFGWHVVVARIAWYLYSNADFAVVGRVLGKAALGAYTVGWTIASIPVDRVTALVGSVTPPVFSAVQHDPPALQRYLKNLTEGLALITFPASVGLALVADEFVIFALGDHWRPAIAPLRLLALSAALRSVSPLLPQIIVSTGHTKRNMQFAILAALILPILFYVGTRWDTAGVAAAWLVGHPVFVMPLFLAYVLRLTRLSLSGYLRALSMAASATLLMTLVVLGVRLASPEAWPVGVRLLTQALAGVAVYTAIVGTAHGARLKALWTLLRELRR